MWGGGGTLKLNFKIKIYIIRHVLKHGWGKFEILFNKWGTSKIIWGDVNHNAKWKYITN